MNDCFISFIVGGPHFDNTEDLESPICIELSPHRQLLIRDSDKANDDWNNTKKIPVKPTKIILFIIIMFSEDLSYDAYL